MDPTGPSSATLLKYASTYLTLLVGTNKSEAAWLSTVLKSGTLTDKMSAYVVLVQTSPVHNLATLQQLLNYVTLKSRRPCLMAIGGYTSFF
jgi:ribosome biogenesis protein MAK21